MRNRSFLSVVVWSTLMIASCNSSSSDGGPPNTNANPENTSSTDGGSTDASSSDAAPDGSDATATPIGYDSLTFAPNGDGIGGAIGAPFTFDAAKRYDGDAAFRKVIANYGQTPGNPLVASFDPSKAGTGTRETAIYIDGARPDLAEWSATAGPQGEPAFVFTIKGLNLPSESPTPVLMANAEAKHSVWIWVRRRYDPGYSAYGDADDTNGASSWNQTQGAGLKIGPYAAYGYEDQLAGTTYYGRAGLQAGNGQPNSTADYDLINLPQGSPQPEGVNDTKIGDVTTEWTDGLWRDYLVYLGNLLDGSGVIQVEAQVWIRTLGGGPFVPLGPRLSGPIGPATDFERPRFDVIAPVMLNANLARKTDQHFQVWGWAAFDAEALPDPFHVLPP